MSENVCVGVVTGWMWIGDEGSDWGDGMAGVQDGVGVCGRE